MTHPIDRTLGLKTLSMVLLVVLAVGLTFAQFAELKMDLSLSQVLAACGIAFALFGAIISNGILQKRETLSKEDIKQKNKGARWFVVLSFLSFIAAIVVPFVVK